MRKMLFGLFFSASVISMGDDSISQQRAGGEVGANGEDLSSWITSIGYEILEEIEQNPVEGVSPDEFREALKTKVIFVTDENRSKLENFFGIQILVNPFHGPVGPKVQVVKHTDGKCYMLLDYKLFEGLHTREKKYMETRRDYRTLAHGYVMASGKSEERYYAITAKPSFSALFNALESRDTIIGSSSQIADNNGPREVSLSREAGAISLTELNKKNVGCLVGDLQSKGIIPFLFHAIPKTFPEKNHHIPSLKLNLTDNRLTDTPRWRVSLYTYTQKPGTPNGWVRPGPKWPLYYEASFIMGGGYEYLRFCTDSAWAGGRIPLCVSSSRKISHIKYDEVTYVRDAVGNLLEDKTLVDKLSIVHEHIPDDMEFENRGNPTNLKVSLVTYKECLRKALEKSTTVSAAEK